ncbi:Metal-independent alpha-mannosidase [Trypanosoma melophagium]|uniref:Metal-independent alpha-mannosidase n=1 Tax=Trypanosoma melophagium TaxID=715481 RepID=UPI00351A8D51|nr:Metal-independent alpha-mannosidase [Trypanosoma melophagium]
MQPTVWEGNYALDSLCAGIKSNYEVITADSGNVMFLQPVIRQWIEAMEIILSTMSDQQKSTEMQNNIYPYMFFRRYPHGVFEYYPRKNATGYTGMVRSAFCPSDDMTSMDFLVPSNIMASVSLQQLMELCGMMADVFPEYSGRIGDIHRKARTLRRPVQQGLDMAKSNDNILAYEVDGLGNVTMMDDGNYPSLLSTPFLGYNKDQSLYQRTRSFLLSERNPWYFSGKAGKGIGSPHTGKDMIWPLSLIMQALTSHDENQVIEILETLKRITLPTSLVLGFAWANSSFGLLITDLGERKPHLIF